MNGFCIVGIAVAFHTRGQRFKSNLLFNICLRLADELTKRLKEAKMAFFKLSEWVWHS